VYDDPIAAALGSPEPKVRFPAPIMIETGTSAS
jgi:hypothetical protein